jgi:hypothetical protein
MKTNLNQSSVLKYALVLGTLSALLTGCFVWRDHGHDRDDHRDHDDAPRHEEHHD